MIAFAPSRRFSLAMALLIVPMTIWAIHGSPVTPLELIRPMRSPILSSMVAAGVGLFVRTGGAAALPVLPRLVIEVGSLFAAYLAMLLIVFNQSATYLDLVRSVTLARRAQPRVA